MKENGLLEVDFAGCEKLGKLNAGGLLAGSGLTDASGEVSGLIVSGADLRDGWEVSARLIAGSADTLTLDEGWTAL